MTARSLSILTILLCLWTATSSLSAQDVKSPERTRRLFTVVPRVGLHLGTWAGTLRSEVAVDTRRFRFESDASGNVGAVLGAEALFRLRLGLRLGAGVLVMPALRFGYDSDAEGSGELQAGTVIRLPGILEWGFPLHDRVSLVPGIIPSIMLLLRGEEAKNRADRLCYLGCTSRSYGGGLAIEGELGLMVWLGRQALRLDLRIGYEYLEITQSTDPSVDENLTGTRMTLLAGFEI